MPDVGRMLEQIEHVQQDIAEAERSLESESVKASSGGGMVSVEISGSFEVRRVSIDPSALGSGEVDPDELELLSDMVLAAVNEAIREAKKLGAQRMESAAGGLSGLGGLGDLADLPGLGGLGGGLAGRSGGGPGGAGDLGGRPGGGLGGGPSGPGGPGRRSGGRR